MKNIIAAFFLTFLSSACATTHDRVINNTRINAAGQEVYCFEISCEDETPAPTPEKNFDKEEKNNEDVAHDFLNDYSTQNDQNRPTPSGYRVFDRIQAENFSSYKLSAKENREYQIYVHTGIHGESVIDCAISDYKNILTKDIGNSYGTCNMTFIAPVENDFEILIRNNSKDEIIFRMTVQEIH